MSSDVEKTSLPPGAVEIEARRGDLARITTARNVLCRCQGCGRVFANTGAAASHARKSRHVVHCAYAVEFAFMPGLGCLAPGGAQ